MNTPQGGLAVAEAPARIAPMPWYAPATIAEVGTMTELGTHWERDYLGHGVYHQTNYIAPIAYEGADGLIRRILNDWQQGDGGYPHIISQSRLRTRVAENGDRLLLPVPADDDAWFSISAPFIKIGGDWQRAPLNAFSRVDNLLTSVNANANVYVWYGGHFVKLGILLKNDWQPADGLFAFQVGLNGLTRSGGVLSYQGTPVVHLRKPVVWDYDNPDDERDIAHEFVQVNGQWYIVFTLPDLSGMSKPLVDPTLTLQPAAAAGKDTRLQAAGADVNYGTNAELKTDAGADHSIIEFDLSSIAAGTTCDSATLSLWSSQSATAQTYNIFSLAAAVAEWAEDEATWNDYKTGSNWPGSGGASTSGTDYEASSLGSIAYPASSANTEATAALTASRVEGWFDSSNTNYGIVVGVTGSTAARRWHSSDAATAAYRPKLTTVYSTGFDTGSIAVDYGQYDTHLLYDDSIQTDSITTEGWRERLRYE